MGNLVSRCTNEISNVFRNCRSQKSEGDRKSRRKGGFESLDGENADDRHGRRLDKAERGYVQHGAHSPAAESRRELLAGSCSTSRIEDDWLPECDQTRGSSASGTSGRFPQSVSADSFLARAREFPNEPVLSKEYIIQTYRIPKPEECMARGDSLVCFPARSNGDQWPADSAGQGGDGAVGRVSGIKPHCSDFKPKRGEESCMAPQKTVEEIATESYLGHLRWQKEMDLMNASVQSRPPYFIGSQAKTQPITEIQPQTGVEESHIREKDSRQPKLGKSQESVSFHRPMLHSFGAENNISPTSNSKNFTTAAPVYANIGTQETDFSRREVGFTTGHVYANTDTEQTTDFSRREVDVILFDQQLSKLKQELKAARGFGPHSEVHRKCDYQQTKSKKDPEDFVSYDLSPTESERYANLSMNYCAPPLKPESETRTTPFTELCVSPESSHTRSCGNGILKGSAEKGEVQIIDDRIDAGSRETGTETPKGEGEGQVPENVRKLEQRQEKVLQELQKLQQSVQSLAQQRGVNLTAATAPSQGAAAALGPPAQSPLQNGKLHDLVISADPSSVPLSLLVLLKQLSTQCQVLTSTFVHSSATDTPEKLRIFLQNGHKTEGPRSTYQLAVTLVWKKIANGPRLMVSPVRQTYIEGEANIARYLSRLLQPAYDSSSVVTATQIDELLDLSQQQILNGNTKERSAALRTLNARLGKGQWLVGSGLTLADVVTWSAVQGARLAQEAPANVKKWLKSCAASDLFLDAVKFIPS